MYQDRHLYMLAYVCTQIDANNDTHDNVAATPAIPLEGQAGAVPPAVLPPLPPGAIADESPPKTGQGRRSFCGDQDLQTDVLQSRLVFIITCKHIKIKRNIVATTMHDILFTREATELASKRISATAYRFSASVV